MLCGNPIAPGLSIGNTFLGCSLSEASLDTSQISVHEFSGMRVWNYKVPLLGDA